MNAGQDTQPLLQIEHLKKYFEIPGKGELHAVDDISLNIYENETLGLVGESGCGKSTVGNVLMQLAEATEGKIIYDGTDLVTAHKSRRHQLRSQMQMVFQDPYSSLNPRQTVRSILKSPLQIHKMAKGQDLDKKVEEMADMVGLEPYVLEKFPHELDGGKRQMVGIARALALNPKFIVCDEPVSALDVSVQATIINLLMNIQKKMGLTYLFVSHDLSVVRHISDRVAVMYLGQIVELAPTDVIFENTYHPYSIALLSAVPKIEFDTKMERIVLNGDVPSPLNPKPGCRFAPRCWMACEECGKKTPELKEVEEGHFVACPYWQNSRQKSKELS
ncbi:ATP-binding cassette domain-containing protein [Clostridium sp. MCC353]|uniref:ABC transporter ATP-binding protein n=1 Tax=Clostridium sp. MCC353 TaxID=2592646 RepID=UPI001C02D0AE|nr:oligopeptide/dipeptide ABC transporter ATP-binding protein [Clostridium sp. MCC353]MBT9777796.1 ATP-binding cassette domain-containing protein [Clostridium sp. MCC353]